ncbi:MAG TPA: di-heme-cytochrome C peroxidase [Candidatus Sulfotelmatobacter sp.]|nr:di-heme-cytochrome C peroxidase [Candidatus Sulfotelmatobacter sp.]
MMKKVGLVVVAILVTAVVAGIWVCENLTVEVPNYPSTHATVWLEQNWTPEQRSWFNHADQGTQTFFIPYEWFMALEQPLGSTTPSGMLSDPAYLDRYGFIPDDSHSGKPELPVGFAHGGTMRNPDGTPWLNSQTNAAMTQVGLTCAACHTGRFTYKSTAVMTSGAPALLNLEKFQVGVGLALLYTKILPFRFSRFADRVLGPGASEQAKGELRKKFDEVVSKYNAINTLNKNVKRQSINEGFARLDALNRIGDIVFAVDFSNPDGPIPGDNYAGTSAPVHFPRIWNSSWFLWVQYNGSIEQPMTRNAGEALGVGAWVNFTGSKDQQFASSVEAKNIFEIEQLLAGKPPDAHTGFRGLNSPKWPESILPPIDGALAAKGAALYKENCQPCHMAPVTDPEFWGSNEWTAPNSAGERYLNLEQIPVKHIGTDPSQAEDMMNRRVAVPADLGIANQEFGLALGQVVDKTLERWYDSQQPPVSPAVREQMNGYRPAEVRALDSYKVRPLDGVWATPPYLHNGSVPTVYALLSPVEERPKKFHLGNREYDPVNLGYRTEEIAGDFELDTTIRGNSNSGHEFNNVKREGVIGRLLTPDERHALIEYLKTLAGSIEAQTERK